LAGAHNSLGMALARRGQVDAAITHFQRALEIKSDFAAAHNNLAIALAGRGDLDSAIGHYRQALDIMPDFAEAHYNLGIALARSGRGDLAIAHYQKALELKPRSADFRQRLAILLAQRQRMRETLATWREAIRRRPNDAALLNNTAWALATNPDESIRDGIEAVELAEQALKFSRGNEPEILSTLAAAYAEAGRFPEALATVRKARELARQGNNSALAEALQARVAGYEAGKPYYETPSVSSAPVSNP